MAENMAPPAPSPTPEQIADARKKAEGEASASAKRIQELAKLADDESQPELVRIRSMIQMVMIQQQAMMKMGGMGTGIRDVIREATPRLEAFSGNVQQMGADIETLKNSVARLEGNLYAIGLRLGLTTARPATG